MAKSWWKSITQRVFGNASRASHRQSSDPIQMELGAWKEVELDNGNVAFERAPGDVLSAFSFDIPPDIPCALSKLTTLRSFYREQISEAGGGIVSITIVEVDGVEAIEAIFKVPQEPTGMTYLASLTIPFRDQSYVVKVECPEIGMTGLRETIVVASLGDAVDFEDWEKEWAQDPYDPTHRGPALRNKAEEEEWDAQFPEHPLSRARTYLKELRETTKLSEALKSAAPFTGDTEN